jgi:hypothetical protein
MSNSAKRTSRLDLGCEPSNGHQFRFCLDAVIIKSARKRSVDSRFGSVAGVRLVRRECPLFIQQLISSATDATSATGHSPTLVADPTPATLHPRSIPKAVPSRSVVDNPEAIADHVRSLGHCVCD